MRLTFALGKGRDGWSAFVPVESGVTNLWSIDGGVITSVGGAQGLLDGGENVITFQPTAAGTMALSCAAVNAVGAGAAAVVQVEVLPMPAKPTLEAPVDEAVKPANIANVVAIPITFTIHLNRPGKFTAEFIATDKTANKEAKLSLPITVFDVKTAR